MSLPFLRRGHRPRLAIAVFLFVAAAAWATEPARAEPSAPETTVCEALRAHGLPIGLLPRGATEFRIDGDGRFEVRLGRACSARFEGEMRYDANVTGTLSYGQIGALSGVSAQELFLWFPVTGIRVDDPASGLIHFDVGVVHKQFPLSLFDTPPDCGAGEPPAAAEDLHERGEIAMSVEKRKSGMIRSDLEQEAAGRRTAVL